MGFRTGSYATVWDATPKTDTRTDIRISINRKNKSTNEYVHEFSGFVGCYGTAVAKQAARLKRGDRIKLGDVDVTNAYDKEKKTTHTFYKLFAFEELDDAKTEGKDNKTNETVDSGEVEAEEIDDSQLPF